MITRLILHFLPFIVPFVVYLIWMRIGHGRPITTREGPWVMLTGLGLAFALIAMIFFRIVLHGADPSGTYIPPHMEDGRLVPGQVIPDTSQQ